MKEVVSDRKRARKALRLANRILLSYTFLFLSKRIIGKKYYNRKIQGIHERNANRVKQAILELKGLFTKIGQLLSMMSNILPKAYATVLESLQDNAPASRFDYVKKCIEEDLGEPIEALFAEFNAEPIASASIGQVHKATLKSGEVVAVKVQHENITELAQADLEIIRKLIKRVSFFIRIKGLDFVYEQVKKMILDELDFGKERNSMLVIGNNLKDVAGVSVPQVYSEYSSARIITTAYQHAVKITQVEQLKKWKLDGEELSRKFILAYCKMILEDGFYHADPHPGNVFVREDGEIILLDFGATAELSEEMRKEIPLLIQAAIRKDYDQVVQSLQKMGFVGDDNESRKVAKQIIETFSHFLANEVSIKNLNLSNISFDDIKGSSIDRLRRELGIRELTKTVRVPKDWVLLDRTIILISGISAVIAPKLDPIEVVKPYMKEQMMKNGGWRTIITDAIKQQLNIILSLPLQIDTFLKKANNGELQLEVNNDTARLYALGQQFIMLVGILATILFYYLAKEDYWLTGTSVLGFLLIRSVWKNRFKRN